MPINSKPTSNADGLSRLGESVLSDEPKGPEDSPLYVIKLPPIRAKLKTQKFAAILDHVAHSPHIEGPIVVVIDILKPFPSI